MTTQDTTLDAGAAAPSGPLHPDDGYAYDGCEGYACRSLRATDPLAATPAPRDPGYPYGEFDAAKWAAEFDRIFPDTRPDTATMLGWFANAIMTGWDRRTAPPQRPTGADLAAMPEPEFAAFVQRSGIKTVTTAGLAPEPPEPGAASVAWERLRQRMHDAHGEGDYVVVSVYDLLTVAAERAAIRAEAVAPVGLLDYESQLTYRMNREHLAGAIDKAESVRTEHVVITAPIARWLLARLTEDPDHAS